MVLDKQKIKFKITKNGSIANINISLGYFNDNDLEKILELSMSDDFNFFGTSFIEDEDQLEFSIDANNPMFFAFNRLINEKETLIINDDDTFDEKKKYLEINREENNIKIIFHNNISNSYDKFNIFIKNIFNDGRSKMSSDVKSKLCKLFFELEEILQNKNHQYTLDEYYELLKSKNNIKEDNPFIKRLSCN